MSRQNSMSYPGQGRVKDPQLARKTPMEVAKDRERRRSRNPIGTCPRVQRKPAGRSRRLSIALKLIPTRASE